MSTFPPSLSHEELVWLSKRSLPGSIERRLLWEIKRLRAVALRTDQFAQTVGRPGGAAGIIYDALRTELDAEACVQESRAVKKALLKRS